MRLESECGRGHEAAVLHGAGKLDPVLQVHMGQLVVDERALVAELQAALVARVLALFAVNRLLV